MWQIEKLEIIIFVCLLILSKGDNYIKNELQIPKNKMMDEKGKQKNKQTNKKTL